MSEFEEVGEGSTEDFGQSGMEKEEQNLTGEEITDLIANITVEFIDDKKKADKFRNLYTKIGTPILNSLGVGEIFAGGGDLTSLPKPVRIALILAIIGVPPVVAIKMYNEEYDRDPEETKKEMNDFTKEGFDG